MRDARGKDGASPGWHKQLLVADLSAQHSRLYHAFFSFLKMLVKRWAVHMRWQRTFNGQNDLPVGLTHSLHAQNFSRVPVLQPEKIVHDCPHDRCCGRTKEASGRWR